MENEKKTLFNSNFVDISTAVKKTLDHKLDQEMERCGVTDTLNKYEQQKNAFSYVSGEKYND